jgi:hypothetical protein
MRLLEVGKWLAQHYQLKPQDTSFSLEADLQSIKSCLSLRYR